MSAIAARRRNALAQFPLRIAPLFVLLVAGDFLGVGGTTGRHWWIDIAWTLGGSLATWRCAGAARRSTGSDRRVWLVFAIACASWLLGQLAWDYFELFSRFPESPSLADIGYLGFAPICMVGLAVMVTDARSGRALLVLDAAVLVCAVTIVCITAYWTNIQASPLSVPGQITGMLYPILYGSMTLAILAVPLERAWRDMTLRWLLIGMLAHFVAFAIWTPGVLSRTYSEGGVVDLLWIVGLVAIATSAQRFQGFREVKSQNQLFGFVAYVPLAAASVAVVLRIWDYTRAGMQSNIHVLLGTLTALIVLLTVTRLAITLRRGDSLLRQTRDVLSALKESEERFRTIFQWAPFGIEIADIDGRLVATNLALQTMLGYSEEELSNIDYMAISHPDDVAQEAALDEQLLAGEIDHYQIVKRHVRKDGEHIWTRLTASSVRSHSGMNDFAVGMVEDITARKEGEEQLRYQALHDSLTDLPNRQLLWTGLEAALRAARTSSSACSLLLMDLDRFKDINDTFGHPYGDALLREVSARLVQHRRRQDTVARLGGDEFAIVLPDANVADAMHIAASILQQFEQPFLVHGQPLHIQPSIGIAAFPDHSNNETELLRQADIAMYDAKRAGTGFAEYSATQDQQSQRRIVLAGALREAIDEGQLTLHYQPKARCSNGEVVGVEALVRWHHPQYGLVSPDEFIPLAEHSGLIGPLTLWVLDEALRQSAVWRQQGLAPRVWANLSARTLRDRDLPQTIHALLRRRGTPPSTLGLEVTESAVMEEPDRALEVLRTLADMGIQIAIDDFGTGYSSLSYLQRLPVQELKIDRSFVSRMAEDKGDCSIVQATINLAHDLGIEVVAEGVELGASWLRLSHLGCDLIQGYYLSRPLSGDALGIWMQERTTPMQRIMALQSHAVQTDAWPQLVPSLN